MKAIIITSPNKASVVTDRALPTLRDDYILIKTKAVALNPTDWKHIDLTITPGVLIGCDYSGIVVDVGPKVTKKFAKGDRVMGFVHGGNSSQPEDGAFADYIVAKGDLQIRIPDKMSFEDAATFGVGITSVGQALYQALKLPLPTSPSPDPHPILIYGGSTATGILGIQLAKLSGYLPITTCSPHNFDFAIEMGAKEVFDYAEDEAPEEIRSLTRNKLTVVWDVISLPWSASFCMEALSTEGGKYTALLPSKVLGSHVETTDTLAYSVFGEEWVMGTKAFAAKPEDFEFGKMWWAMVETLMAEDKIKPHNIRMGQNGLAGVLEGLELLRDSKISGEKLVYLVN
ncbi:putative zinc-binding oxidoreductase ToxD [Leptodontidium sp. 2 PMI_412]|nr:putative zinc-binding oxidoreductase ToxD [Leptodontidium sp. 2 PMI_412]